MFDEQWDLWHQTRTQNHYPDNDITLFVRSVFPENQGNTKVLDLGCGQGSHTWFLAREGYAATAVDGSETALTKLRERLESENLPLPTIQCIKDLTKLPFQDNTFDCVLDIMTLCCNDYKDIGLGLEEVHRVLVPGGFLYSRMPYDTGYHDPYAFHKIINYVTYERIAQLFANKFYTIVSITSKGVTGQGLAHWDIRAKKI